MTPAVDIGATHRYIGKRVAAHRAFRGWSQDQLAKAASLNPKTISELESARPSKTETVLRVAQALGIPAGALLDGGSLSLR